MDQQLKQRLIGVTIVVALVVIFVPMLFEKSDDKGKFGSLGIPSIPEDVMEKTIELPKEAEELAPKEEEKTPEESGYKLVPLNEEELPPKPKSSGDVADKKPSANSGEEEDVTVDGETEGGKASAADGRQKKKPEIQAHPAEKPSPAPGKPAATQESSSYLPAWFPMSCRR